MSKASTVQGQTRDEIVAQHGDWTAMCIHLGGGQYTLTPTRADRRLYRFVQMVADLVGKPLDQIRLLDLACLEGHYAIEFALHGAQTVGIEIREAHLAKARWVASQLGLSNVQFFQDDVRNLSARKYGTFDVVLCAGILYHLDAPDVLNFVRRISEVCTRLAIIDSMFGLHDRVTHSFEGHAYHGLYHTEHDPEDSADQKADRLWSAIDNPRSFWLTPPSLFNLARHVGFTSVYECHTPGLWPEQRDIDRRTYAALKGQRARVISSPITEQIEDWDVPEKRPAEFHASQYSPAYLAARRFVVKLLPRSVKDVVAPVLRALHLLERDRTPAYMKKTYLKKTAKKG